MKQLSALGVRRQFYRNPRRLRALRPGEELDGADLLGQHGFNYFVGQWNDTFFSTLSHVLYNIVWTVDKRPCCFVCEQTSFTKIPQSVVEFYF